MRIAFVVDRFPVVSETFVINQITGLLDRGHEVDILAKVRVSGPLPPDVALYGLLDRTTFWPPYDDGRARRWLGAAPFVARSVRRIGLAGLRAIDLLHYGVEAASGNVAYAAAALSEPRRYDAILAHFGNVGVRAQALRDMGLLSGPLATVFHGFDISVGARGKRSGQRWMGYRALFERGDLFLPVSERWRTKLIDLGCPADRIQVHRMGIDTARFELRGPSRSGPRLRLISVARLVEKKGISYALEAVRLLASSGIDVSYTVVGDGPLRTELEGRARGLRNVTFTGALPPPSVVELLRESDVLLAPSVVARDGDEEGLPVAIMEAMASGLIVIASRHSGIPELVSDGATGYLVREADANALAAAVRRASGEHLRWEQIRRAARREVERQHDIGPLVDRLVEILGSQATRRDGGLASSR